MKMKRDTLTGIVGLIGSLIWLYLIQVQTKQPKKLLEPGPRPTSPSSSLPSAPSC